MKTLYINTCFDNVIIKFFNKNKIIAEDTITGQHNNSQFIMPSIKKVLNDDKPESIIVVNGPGSFTGVRLGVTIAKTFAYVLNIPIRTITSLEEIAFSIDKEKQIFGINDKNGYYIGIFDVDNNLVGDYKYLSNIEYDKFNSEYKVITDVSIDYNKVLNNALKKEPQNAHSVKPIYIKLIEVEKDDKKS